MQNSDLCLVWQCHGQGCTLDVHEAQQCMRQEVLMQPARCRFKQQNELHAMRLQEHAKQQLYCRHSLKYHNTLPPWAIPKYALATRRTCIQDADIINPAVGRPPEVERIPASLGVHATISCPWELNGHPLDATLSARVGRPCVDLWVPCGADVERQGPVKVNIIWTNL
jgi:hypothetical protein